MAVFMIICFCMCYAGSFGSSFGSNMESSLQCSKYHFEERILEKLVRIEHRLEIYDEKMKTWENLVPSNLDKIDDAKKQTETFLESMRNTLNQEYIRLNDSLQETVDHIYIQSETKVKDVLDSVSTTMEEYNESQQKRENVFDSLQTALQQERTRFNKEKIQLNDSYQETVENIYLRSEKKVKNVLNSLSTKMEEFNESQQKREKVIDNLQSNLQQERTRFNKEKIKLNDSYQETVENIYLRSEKKVKNVVDSLSTRISEFQNNSENVLQLLQSNLVRDRKQFNQSIHQQMDQVAKDSNKMIQNFISEQKDVGFFACYTGGLTFQSGTVVKFQTIRASTGISDLSSFISTGKFTCKVSGFYIISVHIMSNTDAAHYEVLRNSTRILHIFPPKRVQGWYTTSSSVVSTRLDVNDTVFVKTLTPMTIASSSGESCISINKT